MQVVYVYVQYMSMVCPPLVLIINDVVVNELQTSTLVLFDFQHMECLLLIYFCICYCC